MEIGSGVGYASGPVIGGYLYLVVTILNFVNIGPY